MGGVRKVSSPSERFAKKIIPKGYELERSGRGKHIRIICPDGSVLRDKITGMPVTISSSPSGKWESRVKRDIERATKEEDK